MATIDPASYLRSLPPFDALPGAAFAEATRALDVAYHPAGTHLARIGGEPLRHLYVIRKGSVRLERDGQTLQLLEEGELFGYTSLISGEANLDVVVDEDLVAYRLPEREFRRLLSDAAFAGHFAVGIAERLRSSLERPRAAAFQLDLATEVQQLLHRPARWIEARASVREAARVMRDEGISSVLLRTDPPSIVTDRDLRNRVLADDLGPETAAAEIASSPIRSVPGTTPIYAAWRVLLDAAVHHLPVVRGGEIAGVLTSGDLLKHSARGPVATLRSVERLAGRTALPGYAAQVKDMASALVAGGLDATVIAGLVARLNDVLTHRILRWAESDLGAPPTPYAWLVFGSEGRMEQTLLTDQDNFIAYDDAAAAAGKRGWFQRFAERVNEDLESAGFPRCPGGHMARNHHATLTEWRRRFDACVDDPSAHEAELWFDFRPVGGHLDVAPLEAAMGRARRAPLLLRSLADEALGFGPPAALLLRVRGGTVNLKTHGITPIVFLARCHALEIGSPARSTTARLDAALQAGLLSAETHALVSEAFRFLLGLRLRVQLRALDAPRPVSNEVALADLGPVERSRLKDAFRAIRTWQTEAGQHYHAGGT